MDMAPTMVSESPSQSVPSIRAPNIRNPLPLSAAQEAQVRDLYYKRVRSRCADEIKAFADCARGRTFSTSWACRTQHFAMNSCMVLHANPIEEDAAREEWFAGVEERRRKREAAAEAVEKRRLEVIELTRRQEEKERLEQEKQVAEGTQKKGWWR